MKLETDILLEFSDEDDEDSDICIHVFFPDGHSIVEKVCFEDLLKESVSWMKTEKRQTKLKQKIIRRMRKFIKKLEKKNVNKN